jgi:hypothetical protein
MLVSEEKHIMPDDSLAEMPQIISHEREALAACPEGHPDRARLATSLGAGLCIHYQQIRDVALINEAIEVQREALSLHPHGHLDRGHSCSDLGVSLYELYRHAGEAAILDEALELQREALALQPPGHPDRAFSCNNLAASLHAHYLHRGDLTLLNEAIGLKREALALRPPGHSERAFTCGSLGSSLREQYQQCGGLALLNEAIELERETLALPPADHPDRAVSCTNLATSLHARYQQSGTPTLLDESIELVRKVLALLPSGHPDRVFVYNNLGSALQERYRQCGDPTLLDEVTALAHGALALLPPGHPQRADGCAGLANSLYVRYEQCGDLALLEEAIELGREALRLRPLGHSERALSCSNLAASLWARYGYYGNLTLLDETIKLLHEALTLSPLGHPQRSQSCRDLSRSLIECYKRTKDVTLLDEVIKLCDSVMESDTSLEASRAFVILSELHSIPETAYFSLDKTLHYLDVSFGTDVDNVREVIRITSDILSRIWSLSSICTPQNTLLLGKIYSKIIDRLPLAVSFVLDIPSRLQILKSTHHLGTDACVAAVLASQLSTAVELLDRAHGLVWTQALHQRDPQMEGAPTELASELAGLLRKIAAPLTTQHDSSSLYASCQDSRHRQNTRIQALLREIRAKPGLERFMLGSTYDTLRNAARDHPVVVLVAGRGLAFALIMSNAAEDQPHALGLDLTSKDLQTLQNDAQEAGLRSAADTREGKSKMANSRMRFKKSGLHDHHKPLRVLAKIWHKIVKPVLEHLKLEVRAPTTLLHVG